MIISKTYKYLLIIIFIVLLTGCNKADSQHNEMVSQLVGKKIKIPDNLITQIIDQPISYDFSKADFKIVTYIDSAGCTPCRMKVKLWNQFIEEVMSIPDISFEYLMVINTRNISEIETLLNRENFLHPIAIDRDNQLIKDNNLPTKEAYCTFLLDANNTILAIGNPVINPKIKELYLKIMRDAEGYINEDDILSPSTIYSQSLGAVKIGDCRKVSFTITNKDKMSHTIQSINPSCDCVSATTDTGLINIGSDLNVELTFKPDSTIGPFCRFVDFYYNQTDRPERVLVHGYTITDSCDICPK
jgi:hypothetical protein